MSVQAHPEGQTPLKQKEATQIEQYFRSMAGRIGWHEKTQPPHVRQFVHMSPGGSELVAYYRGGYDRQARIGLFITELEVIAPEWADNYAIAKKFRQIYGGRLLDMTDSTPEDFVSSPLPLEQLVGVVQELHDSYVSATQKPDSNVLDMVHFIWESGNRIPGFEIIEA